MAVFDLKDAYLVVSIAGVDVKFLKFTFQGKHYMYVVLPFGLSSAPRKFKKLLKPILSALRHQGIIITVYIDDGWTKGDTFQEYYQSVRTAMKLFSNMGFLLHPEKSVPMPHQEVAILGFNINSVTMQISISEGKTKVALEVSRNAIKHRRMSIRELARVIGILISLLPACPLGRAHYRSLELVKLRALMKHGASWDSHCRIDIDSVMDLKWWIRNLPSTCAPIKRSAPDMVMFTDASDEGWGAVFQGVHTQGRFTLQEQELDINSRELIAMDSCLFIPTSRATACYLDQITLLT